MKRLVNTTNLSKEQWLKYRQMGIGGSDASIIVGKNPWKSVYELWLEKTGKVELKEEENDYVHFGSILESVVRDEFTRRTGIKVRRKNAILQSEEYPFMLANLDGVIYESGELVIFEAKTASAYKLDVWEKGIPEEYNLQLQHYMAVTGAKKAYIAALVGGNRFIYHEVCRDEELIKWLTAKEYEFWKVNVLQGKEPEFDGSKASSEYLKRTFVSANNETISLPKEAEDLCYAYDELSNRIDSLSEKKEAISNKLKGFLGNNKVGVAGERKVSWINASRTTFDQKRLQEEQEEIFKKYTAVSHYRRFKVA